MRCQVHGPVSEHIVESRVLSLLGEIAGAASADAAFDLGLVFFRDRGFSRVNYGLTRFRTERSLGNPDDALYLSSCPPAYTKLYFTEGFFLKTPLFRWVTQNVGACTWRWVKEAYEAGTLPASEVEAVQQNHKLGVTAGISISFPVTSNRSKAALGLIADEDLDHDRVDAIWALERDAFMAVANMMHLTILQLPLVTRRRPLTDRQREVLEWVADGKTTQDIATIMGVSTAMVEKHLRLAREALDVETTAQAVAKGTLLNSIFLRPEPSVFTGR